MDVEKRIAVTNKLQDLKLLKPKIRMLIRTIKGGKEKTEERKRKKTSSMEFGSYRELQNSRNLYQRLFMDQKLEIEALNIAENPKLKEMNQAIREKSEKKSKLVVIFAELLDRKRSGGGSVLHRKLRQAGKDKTEKFSNLYTERTKSPELYQRQTKTRGHSRCGSCLSRIAQTAAAADWL